MGKSTRMNKMKLRRFSPIRNYDDINFKNCNIRINKFNPTLPKLFHKFFKLLLIFLLVSCLKFSDFLKNLFLALI